MNHRETNAVPETPREITVEKWVYGGSGLARLDGQVALTPYVLPGEVVRVRVERRRPGLLETRALEVVSAAEGRIEAACPHFARCGGCHYQHAGYPFQLAQKVSILREVFARVGKLTAPEEIAVVSGPPWEYRNRAQFHLNAGHIGFLEAGTHRLCPVERCPIASPRINEGLAALREMMRDGRFPRFVRAIELFTNETETQLNVLDTGGAGQRVARRFFEWCAGRIPGAAAGALNYPAAGETFRVSHHSFFQVNRFLTDDLVRCALERAGGETALDLYAGVGLFSLPLARRFREVTAVESGAAAARDLEFNASRAGLAVRAVQSGAEEFLESATGTPDFTLADPPRAGLGKHVVRHLLRLRPRRLHLVACDPATLARDLAALAAGGYRIERITLADLFPQTCHIETVTELSAG